MTRFLIKTLISALVISGVSELGKRSTGIAALVAALPLTTLMTVLWLYSDTRDPAKVADLSIGIFWAILPSLIFMLALPWLLRGGIRFSVALPASLTLMFTGYAVYVWALGKFGVRF